MQYFIAFDVAQIVILGQHEKAETVKVYIL